MVWTLFFPFMLSIDKKNYKLIVNRTTDSSKSSPWICITWTCPHLFLEWCQGRRKIYLCVFAWLTVQFVSSQDGCSRLQEMRIFLSVSLCFLAWLTVNYDSKLLAPTIFRHVKLFTCLTSCFEIIVQNKFYRTVFSHHFFS